MSRCTNNAVEKAAEVKEQLRRWKDHPGMSELYQRGCFRHSQDVAYAAIMLTRGQSIDIVAAEIDEMYEGPDRHHCDRVFPPS